jgi:hypothetical protein
MGFFSWLLCSILVVALVLLLFPFSVRIEFEAGERGARALFFFFKKKVYEAKKNWGKEQVGSRKSEVESEENVKASTKDKKSDDGPKQSSSEQSFSTEGRETISSHCNHCEGEPLSSSTKSQKSADIVAKAPETPKEKKTTAPIEVKPPRDDKNVCHPERSVSGVEESSVVEDDCCEANVQKDAAKSVPEEKKTADVKDDAKAESAKSEKKPKKEKRKLSDREFWTILLTPDLDARAFRYVLKILGAVFSLFHIRFSDCYVEGIRTDYQTMGYIAAVNGFLKAYPYVGDWDLQMDWSHEKELHAAGNVRLSITLLRIFCFVLETLVLAGILAFIFWRRRAHVIKTNELPELGFVRKKILNIILED